MYLGLATSATSTSSSKNQNYGSMYIPSEFREFLISYCNSARRGLRYWSNESEVYDHTQQVSYCWWKGREKIDFYWWVKDYVLAYLNENITTDDLIDEQEYLWENREYDKADALMELLRVIFKYKGIRWYYDGGSLDRELDRDEYYESLYRG